MVKPPPVNDSGLVGRWNDPLMFPGRFPRQERELLPRSNPPLIRSPVGSRRGVLLPDTTANLISATEDISNSIHNALLSFSRIRASGDAALRRRRGAAMIEDHLVHATPTGASSSSSGEDDDSSSDDELLYQQDQPRQGPYRFSEYDYEREVLPGRSRGAQSSPVIVRRVEHNSTSPRR